MSLRAVIAFVRLGRPLFLGGGFLMFALGAALARWQGIVVDSRRYVLGQLVVTLFQLMTHYANDYFDFEADRANTTPTRWSGGSRVLASDELPRGVALAAAIVLAVLGVVAAILLSLDAPRATPFIIGAIALLAWEYSAPPLRLCATGLGELTTAIVVTMLVPGLGYYLHAGRAHPMLALLLVPPVMLQLAMLLAIEFPDAAGDAATGKRTLVVRLGARTAAQLYAALTVGAFAWLPLAFALGLKGHVALFTAIPLPLAIWRVMKLEDYANPAAHERMTFAAVALLIATPACTLAALL